MNIEKRFMSEVQNCQGALTSIQEHLDEHFGFNWDMLEEEDVDAVKEIAEKLYRINMLIESGDIFTR